MNKEEKEAIDILENCIADYVIGDFCCGKYCPDEDVCKEKDCPYETAIEMVVNLIQKQDKIIDKMAEKINQAYFDKENMYIWFEEKILPKDEFGLCEYKDLGTRKTRIKEYFKKEVEKDVKD